MCSVSEYGLYLLSSCLPFGSRSRLSDAMSLKTLSFSRNGHCGIVNMNDFSAAFFFLPNLSFSALGFDSFTVFKNGTKVPVKISPG